MLISARFLLALTFFVSIPRSAAHSTRNHYKQAPKNTPCFFSATTAFVLGALFSSCILLLLLEHCTHDDKDVQPHEDHTHATDTTCQTCKDCRLICNRDDERIILYELLYKDSPLWRSIADNQRLKVLNAANFASDSKNRKALKEDL